MRLFLALPVLLVAISPAPALGVEPEVILKVQGRLSADDPKDSGTKHPHQVHEIKLVAGNTYIIDMESKEFDTFLRLEDPAGKHLVHDDDGGGVGKNLNARITIRIPKDGLYRVIATTYASTGKGQYTVIVRQTVAK